MSLKSIYQEVILDHNRKPRNYGSLTHPTHHATGHNPLCGDHIELDMNVQDGHIKEIAFRGESCAICKASTSMMTNAVKGKALEEAETLIQDFRGMLVDGSEQSLQRVGRLKVLAGVRDLPTRIKCAILPWHTLHAAMNSTGSVTTETDKHTEVLAASNH